MSDPRLLLLVEDDEDDAYFTQRVLAGLAPHVSLVVVSDGDEAVDYLAGQGRWSGPAAGARPDHVLLDLKLPRRSGLDVLRWIRGQPALHDLPVTVMSGSGLHADVAEAQELGAVGYIRKPVGLDEFRVAFNDFCRSAGFLG